MESLAPLHVAQALSVVIPSLRCPSLRAGARLVRLLPRACWLVEPRVCKHLSLSLALVNPPRASLIPPVPGRDRIAFAYVTSASDGRPDGRARARWLLAHARGGAIELSRIRQCCSNAGVGSHTEFRESVSPSPSFIFARARTARQLFPPGLLLTPRSIKTFPTSSCFHECLSRAVDWICFYR